LGLPARRFINYTDDLLGLILMPSMQVLDILICLSKRVIQFPTTRQQWRVVADDFETIGDFPDVAAAIDGSLFEIERPYEYDGWMCHKGFAAINMQASVDVVVLCSSLSGLGHAATRIFGSCLVLELDIETLSRTTCNSKETLAIRLHRICSFPMSFMMECHEMRKFTTGVILKPGLPSNVHSGD